MASLYYGALISYSDLWRYMKGSETPVPDFVESYICCDYLNQPWSKMKDKTVLNRTQWDFLMFFDFDFCQDEEGLLIVGLICGSIYNFTAPIDFGVTTVQVTARLSTVIGWCDDLNRIVVSYWEDTACFFLPLDVAKERYQAKIQSADEPLKSWLMNSRIIGVSSP